MAAKIDGTKLLASINFSGGGVPYYYSGGSWSFAADSIEPSISLSATTTSSPSISNNGSNYVLTLEGVNSGTNYSGIYLYSDSSWSELVISSQYYFLSAKISGDGTKVLAVAENISSGYQYIHYYNGSSWSDITPITSGAYTVWEIDISDDGTKFIAVDRNSYVYTYNGLSWTTHKPAGDENTYFICPNISADGTKFSAVRYSTPQKLYYYDGSSWSEISPLGETEATYCLIDEETGTQLGDIVMAKSGNKKFFFTNFTDSFYFYTYDGSTSTIQDPFTSSGYLAVPNSIDCSFSGNKLAAAGVLYDNEFNPYYKTSYYNGSSWSDISIKSEETPRETYLISMNKYQDETVSPFPSFRVV